MGPPIIPIDSFGYVAPMLPWLRELAHMDGRVPGLPDSFFASLYGALRRFLGAILRSLIVG